MIETTGYQVTVSDNTKRNVETFLFLEHPTPAELIQAVEQHIEALEDDAGSCMKSGDEIDADIISEQASNMARLVEIIRLLKVIPLPDEGLDKLEAEIRVAGTRVGKIVVEATPIRRRDENEEIGRLVA